MSVAFTVYVVAHSLVSDLNDSAGWERALAALRLNTQTGRPLSSDSFLTMLEHTLVRRLCPLPVGLLKNEKSETRKSRQ